VNYLSFRSQGKSPNFIQIQNWLSEYTGEQICADDGDGDILEIYPNGYFISLPQDSLKYSSNPAYTSVKELLLQGMGIL